MLRVLTAGESHGPELVAIMEGLPSGVPVSLDAIRAETGEAVPCVVRERDSAILAEEVSLAENIERAPLHPLDQFRAFQALREKGTPYAELGLSDPALSDDQLLDAMLAHPILINRPIVETPRGTRLCRPSEAVLDLLDHPVAEFTKEDGEAVRGKGRRDA